MSITTWLQDYELTSFPSWHLPFFQHDSVRDTYMDFLTPVPRIAAQYIRNGKQHDATARQWTENYTRPKPPPPPPVAVDAPPSPKSTKAKGEKRKPSPFNHCWKFFLEDLTHSDSSRTILFRRCYLRVCPKRCHFPRLGWGNGGPSNGKDKKRKRIQRLPLSAKPMRWPICWIQRKSEMLPRQRKNEPVIRRAE